MIITQATAQVGRVSNQTDNNASLRPPIHEKYLNIIQKLNLIIPDSIIKIHEAHRVGDQDHIHFLCGQSYLMDGSWDYNNGLNLSKETIIFIETIGFRNPQKSDAYANEDTKLEDKSPTEYTAEELKKMTGLNEIPPSIRAVHQAHGNGQQTHIHFYDEERSLNLDGTWEGNSGRALTPEEKQFALRMGFILPQ